MKEDEHQYGEDGGRERTDSREHELRDSRLPERGWREAVRWEIDHKAVDDDPIGRHQLGFGAEYAGLG